MAIHTALTVLAATAACVVSLRSTDVPTVALGNAADPGVLMPAIGLGTGGYTGNSSQPYGAYPECFDGCSDPQCAAADPAGWSGCGEYVEAAVVSWIQLGGRRVDSSASYHNQAYSAIAMRASGVARSELFFTSKVGPYLALGYNESQAQLATTLAVTGLGYVDLLLIHWPSCDTGGGCSPEPGAPVSTDPPCMFGAPTYDAAACRVSTWKGLVQLWRSGAARAIGVSNFNVTHLQDLAAAGLPLPSVNQIPFSLYHSAVQNATRAYCAQHGIHVQGYSPLGVPDRRTYAPPMAPTQLQDPVAVAIAQRLGGGATAADVILAWQWRQGLSVNPRSQNAAHMLANLAQPFACAPLLSDADMAALGSRPQDS